MIWDFNDEHKKPLDKTSYGSKEREPKTFFSWRDEESQKNIHKEIGIYNGQKKEKIKKKNFKKARIFLEVRKL